MNWSNIFLIWPRDPVSVRCSLGFAFDTCISMMVDIAIWPIILVEPLYRCSSECNPIHSCLERRLALLTALSGSHSLWVGLTCRAVHWISPSCYLHIFGTHTIIDWYQMIKFPTMGYSFSWDRALKSRSRYLVTKCGYWVRTDRSVAPRPLQTLASQLLLDRW